MREAESGTASNYYGSDTLKSVEDHLYSEGCGLYSLDGSGIINTDLF